MLIDINLTYCRYHEQTALLRQALIKIFTHSIGITLFKTLMKLKELFRTESLDAKKTKWLSEVTLISPFPIWILTFFTLVLVSILISLIYSASYTKKITVSGQLVLEKGIIKFQSKQNGVITKIFVKEGEVVKNNKTLYEISNTDYNTQILNQYNIKDALIKEQITTNNKIKNEEEINIKNNIENLEKNLKISNKLITEHIKKIIIAEKIVNRYEKILKDNAISKNEIEKSRFDYINQKSLLNSEKINHTNFEIELNNEKSKLILLKHNHENQLLALKQKLSDNEISIIKSKNTITQKITSNIDGKITNINIHEGEFLKTGVNILNIIPTNNSLIAQLYVPSKAIGFVKLNSSIKLRYKSFPYQRFGNAEGKVIYIAQSALAIQDISSIGPIPSDIIKNNEPIYLVKVKLDKQYINLLMNKYDLKPGMLLDADIPQENRKIYEWILEPLFNITGKF
ncbi:HlyD family efflux transporter periplasmic adaptor subunit [Acinetobacter baumannii]|nr:HlyD family efflux transporter periplasmic adaptor subunit [Acinetobacter baumannii]